MTFSVNTAADVPRLSARDNRWSKMSKNIIHTKPEIYCDLSMGNQVKVRNIPPCIPTSFGQPFSLEMPSTIAAICKERARCFTRRKMKKN